MFWARIKQMLRVKPKPCELRDELKPEAKDEEVADIKKEQRDWRHGLRNSQQELVNELFKLQKRSQRG